MLSFLWADIAALEQTGSGATSFRDRYNNLPEVEVANQELKSREGQFKELFKQLHVLVEQHGLQDYIGLRLIHNHFQLDDQQVMCEHFIPSFGEEKAPSLITTPENVSKLGHAKAASWIFTDQGVSPFEYSNDPAVLEGRQKIDQAEGFVEEFGRLVKDARFEHLLSLAIIKRDNFSSRDGAEQTYVENSYFNLEGKKDISVVQLQKGDGGELSIITAWSLQEDYPVRKIVCVPWVEGEDQFHIHRPDKK